MNRLIKFIFLSVILTVGYTAAEAQNIVVGKYNGYNVKVKYYKGTPDDIETLEYGLVTELNKKVARLEGQIRDLNKALEDKTKSGNGSSSATVMELRKQVWDQEKKIVELRDSVLMMADNTQDIKELTDSINGLNARNDDLAARLRDLQSQQGGKGDKGKEKELKNQIAQLEKELKTSKEQSSELDRLLAEKQSEIARLSSLQAKIDESEAKNKQLSKQVDELTEQNRQLSNQIGNQTTQKGEESEQIGKLTEKNQQLSAQVGELEGQNQQLTEQVDALTKANKQLVQDAKNRGVYVADASAASGHHIGLQYRIGIPFVFNQLLAQTDGESRKIWTKNLTLSHQVGLFYGSSSLSSKVPVTLGVGLEYSRVNLAAGIGHLNDTIGNAVDADNDSYSAFLEYRNVVEKVALHYVSVPLTLSFGQPRNDKVSGYGQITIAPGFCVAHTLSSTGTYDCTGHYSQLSGYDVDLYFDDFAPLGFGRNLDVNEGTKVADVSRFLLTGRLSAGLYMPLCNTRKGNTSQWVFKVGVNVDFSITTVAKEMASDSSMPDAIYRLSQYNLLSGHGCRIVNPGLEVGLVYIIKK